MEYALGYIELGLLNEASVELESVSFEDRFSTAVIAARVELHMATKHWDAVVNFASMLVEKSPENLQGWIGWAYALRELDRVSEAREVLLRGEPLHGSAAAILHYNLACYYCLLGDTETAKKRLRQACRMSADWKETALADLDLKPMWDEIASIRIP